MSTGVQVEREIADAERAADASVELHRAQASVECVHVLVCCAVVTGAAAGGGDDCIGRRGWGRGARERGCCAVGFELHARVAVAGVA